MSERARNRVALATEIIVLAAGERQGHWRASDDGQIRPRLGGGCQEVNPACSPLSESVGDGRAP